MSLILLDIINFKNTKDVILDFYYNNYKYLLEYEHNIDKYWLINDILLYIKKIRIDLYIKMNKLYNINSIHKNKIHNQFILFWGKLKPEDRIGFLPKKLEKES